MRAKFNQIGETDFGLAFVVCGNGEVLGVDADDTGLTQDEAIGDVVSAAGRAIEDAGYDYEVDSQFSAWNGGRRAHFWDARSHGVIAHVYERDSEGEWRACLKRNVPQGLIVKAQVVCDATADAIAAELAKLDSRREAAGSESVE